MEKVELFLDTTVDRFLNWLEHYSAHMDDPLFRPKDGYPYVVHPPELVPAEGEKGVALPGFHSVNSSKVEMAATFIRFPVTGWPPHAPSLDTMGTVKTRLLQCDSSSVKDGFDDTYGRYGVWLQKAPVVITLDVLELSSVRVKVTAQRLHPEVGEFFDRLLQEIRRDWPGPVPAAMDTEAELARGEPLTAGLRGEPGRPTLAEEDPEQFIERLALAQWALEIRREDTKKPKNQRKTWLDIIMEVGWAYGSTSESRRQSLFTARKDVEHLEKSDPTNLLEKVEQHRREKDLGGET